MADQNETVHSYSYDPLGRLVADAVTDPGACIDQAVLGRSPTKIPGMLESVTSYDAASGGNVVNEVKLVYNDFGQLVTDYQEHDGAISPSTTPKVQYSYADGSMGHIRPTKAPIPTAAGWSTATVPARTTR